MSFSITTRDNALVLEALRATCREQYSLSVPRHLMANNVRNAASLARSVILMHQRHCMTGPQGLGLLVERRVVTG